MTFKDPDAYWRYHEDIRHGFDAGNYANAYETTDYERALARLSPNRSGDYCRAFTLGFFSSYETHEIPDVSYGAFLAAYHSEAGQACIKAGYCDARDDLPSDESEDM